MSNKSLAKSGKWKWSKRASSYQVEFPFYHSYTPIEAMQLHQQSVRPSLPIQYFILQDWCTYQDTKINSCSTLILSNHLQNVPLSMPTLKCYLKHLYNLFTLFQLFQLIFYQILIHMILCLSFELKLVICLISNNPPSQCSHSF